MVQIQNADAINAIRDGARLSISEGFPTVLANVVQPVLDMTPHFHKEVTIIKTVNATVSGTTTIYSIPAGRRFYMTAYAISGYFLATSDCTSVQMTGTIKGIATNFHNHTRTTLTSSSGTGNAMTTFTNCPIVFDGGTNITITATFTVGGQSLTPTIYGYEVEENH